MYEYDEYNPKKKDEYEETEQESIDYSADGMEDEPHVDGESIEMEAEVISGEEYTEEISGEQFSEEEGFSEQESVSEATAEEGAEKAEAFAEETAEAEQEYTGPCVREYHYEEKVKKLNLTKKLEEAKAAGKIRYIGFSFHDSLDLFKEIIDSYDGWDFCQIQYNYMDEHSQAGVEGLRYAHAKGIPVIIMEPLRGGRLVNLLPESAKELFAQDEEHRTPAELALKWLYDQPEVTCVLSGMNSMEMVEQNVRTASEYGVGCMTESDRALVEAVRQEITKHVKVGCTGCGYCMPCPRGVDIPGTFRCYNAMYSEGKKSGRRDYLQCTAFRKNPASASQCVGCGKCEQHCPQHIEIRRELKAAAGELETVKYKFMKTAIGVLKLW